ncbi:hypothetical protein IW262DRAFT_1239187, partial [Armillaria fumosa]
MGDVYGSVAEHYLAYNAPYPGDEPHWISGRLGRFVVYEVRNKQFLLMDNMHDDWENILVPGSVVKTGEIAAWYHEYCSKHLGFPDIERCSGYEGDVLKTFLSESLNAGLNYDGSVN